MKKRRELKSISINVYVVALKIVCALGATLMLFSDIMNMM